MFTQSPQLEAETPYDVMERASRRETSLGEYLGAKAGQGWDWTIPRMVIDDFKLDAAEKEAYGGAVGAYRVVEGMLGKGSTLDEIRPEVERFFLSQEDYQASEFYREGVEWDDSMTEVRARILAEDFDKRRYREALITRKEPGALTGVLGFGAQMLGTLPDPINFVPFLGPAGKAATFGRAALKGAGEAMIGTAIQDAFVLQDLRGRGEEVGLMDLAFDLTFAGVLGGGFGMAAKGLDGRRLRGLQGRLGAKALEDMAAGRSPNVAEAMTAKEIRQLAELYETARAAPAGGDTMNPSVVLGSEEFEEGLQEVIVTRGGPAREIQPGVYKIKGSGLGLVKVLVKHGELSNEPPGFRVLKEDVLRLPDIIREYEPDVDGRYLTWVVEREDGKKLVYGARGFVEDGRNRLVTIYVERPDAKPKPFSKKKTGGPVSSPERLPTFQKDTAGGTYYRQPRGQDRPVNSHIGTPEQGVKPDFSAAPEPESPFSDAARPGGDEPDLLAQAGIDPRTHDFPEMEPLKELEAQGRLLPEEREALEMADMQHDQALKYEDGFLAAVECVLRNS